MYLNYLEIDVWKDLVLLHHLKQGACNGHYSEPTCEKQEMCNEF